MINIKDVNFHIGTKTKIAGLAVCLAVAMTAGLGTQPTFANATHDIHQAILDSTDDHNLDSINGD